MNLGFGKIKDFEHLGPDLEKAGAENDEDPSKTMSEILDMRSISIKNMEWKCGKSLKNEILEVRNL